MLTNREWATVFWLTVILIVVLLRADGRAGLVKIAKAFIVRPLVVIAGLFVTWIVLEIEVAQGAGLWKPDLAKDTVIWAVTVSLPMLFSSAQEATKPGYFRQQVRRTIGLGVAVGFYLNLVVFPLLVEIPLQLFIAFVAMATSMTKSKTELAIHRTFYERLQAIVGLTFLAVAAAWTATNVRTLDPRELSLSFLLPVWLTIGVLPIMAGRADHETRQARAFALAIRRGRRQAGAPARLPRPARIGRHFRGRSRTSDRGRPRRRPNFGNPEPGL
jgi:hypothetical protein